LKLFLYNFLFLFKRNRYFYYKTSATNYGYTHPEYFQELLSAISNNVNKKELSVTFQNFLTKKVYVFGRKVDIVFNMDFFNNFKFRKNVKKPAFFNKADVKVPYEIGRLQFLQKVMLYNFLENNKNPELNFDLLDEIITSENNKIIWNSPMDVAIRMISLIFVKNFINKIDYINEPSLLTNLDSVISKDFEFVKMNYEKRGNVVGNHYFVELASSLLFIANYDYEDKELDLKSIIDEISKEIELQFNKELTNFEGSSHYAALMTEALLIIYLSLKSLKKENTLYKKIREILIVNNYFIKLITNKGELSQIGDNDSGRLFYFQFDEQEPLKLHWLNNLIEEIIPDSKSYEHVSENIDELENLELNNLNNVTHKEIKAFSDDFKHYSFPEFGLFIWRNSKDYFSIRCGDIGQNGVGGHSHYDQLSIECFSNNKWIARDPGTGTYTDDIKTRNKYRSLEYHWGPKVEMSFPQEDAFDCFKLNYMSTGQVLKFDKFNFVGYADFNGKRIYRTVKFSDGIITIQDFSNDVELGEYALWGEQNDGIKVEFSKGYKRFT
tara:strand:- start:365 stop:2020 length:1656 start_codon:yes stop_codon:yes gene_type:complete